MSSASTVCQGLLEPSFLIPSKQDLSSPWPQKQTENPKNWNFIQSLTNNCGKSSDEQQQVYVHPLVKRSFCSLSTKSLEMCTESLGCETGNGIDSFTTDELSYMGLEQQRFRQHKKTRESCRKVKHSSSFPPPLTSISGNDGVQVQTHREGGRLVIKAFNLTTCGTYFQTERENGRLRLSLACRGNEHEFVAEDEEEFDEVEKKCDESENEADFNGCLWDEQVKENETDFNGRLWDEQVKENEGKIGCKIGNGGDWSSSRCNEDRTGNKRMPSLPFCVAIS